MSEEGRPPTVLPYQPPAHRRAPPMSMSAGCASALFGALLLGIVLPCTGFSYVLSRELDPGGLLFWPALMLFGGIVGATTGPLVWFGVRWIIWITRGRP
jgi:hypothetical protein